MRTLFRSGMDLVPVKDEMEHLKGYLNIQEFRYTDSFTYKVQVDETIQDYKILPLIIHTIVENSIKHSIMKQNIIHIDISVTQVFQDGEAYIKVLVWDTGDGFGEDVLAELQSKQKLVSKGGQRIGLTNLIQRLEYVYEKRASIQFANRKSGGAEVQIMIPACR